MEKGITIEDLPSLCGGYLESYSFPYTKRPATHHLTDTPATSMQWAMAQWSMPEERKYHTEETVEMKNWRQGRTNPPYAKHIKGK